MLSHNESRVREAHPETLQPNSEQIHPDGQWVALGQIHPFQVRQFVLPRYPKTPFLISILCVHLLSAGRIHRHTIQNGLSVVRDLISIFLSVHCILINGKCVKLQISQSSVKRQQTDKTHTHFRKIGLRIFVGRLVIMIMRFFHLYFMIMNWLANYDTHAILTRSSFRFECANEQNRPESKSLS